MTKDEVLKACKWDDLNWAYLEVDSAMLEAKIKVIFMPDIDGGREITEKMVEVLNDFLNLKSSDLEKVKEILWEDAQRDFHFVDYGNEPNTGQSVFDANSAAFKIFDRRSAYQKSNFKALRIEQATEGFKHRYGQLLFRPEWSSHGCGVVMRDGQLIDGYAESVHFGWFEEGGMFSDSPSYLNWRKK